MVCFEPIASRKGKSTISKSDVTGMGMQTEIQKLTIMEATAATPAALGGKPKGLPRKRMKRKIPLMKPINSVVGKL